MNPIYSIFPKQSAAVALTAAHVVDGAQFARNAATQGSAAERIDAALRAANAFDHAVVASKGVPVQLVWKGARQAYQGYQLASQVLKLAISTRAVPDIADRVADVQLTEASRELQAGAASWTGSGRSKYESYRAGGWVEASLRDAVEGAAYLKDTSLTRDVASSYNTLRGQLSKRQELDSNLVSSISARLLSARPIAPPASGNASASASQAFTPELEQALQALAAFGQEARGATR
jgi:hypothetical protein